MIRKLKRHRSEKNFHFIFLDNFCLLYINLIGAILSLFIIYASIFSICKNMAKALGQYKIKPGLSGKPLKVYIADIIGTKSDNCFLTENKGNNDLSGTTADLLEKGNIKF